MTIPGQQPVDTLPDLPGFDTDAALKMLNNNKKLYGNVLKRFLGQYETAASGLVATVQNATDFELIQREAHTLKGLAGTMGHSNLQAAALALETASKSGPGQDMAAYKEVADKFIAELEGVISTLKAAFPA